MTVTTAKDEEAYYHKPDSGNSTNRTVSLESTLSSSNHDEPPPYVSETTAGPSDNLLPPLKRCNFVYNHISNHALKGDYLLDPTLEVPATFLAPLPEGETVRKNLDLATANGPVNSAIHIAPVDYDKSVTISARSKNGPVTVKLYRESSIPHVQLDARTKNGSVRVYIPSSFHGAVTTTTNNGSVTFSDQVKPHVSSFSNVKGVGKYFIGDLVNFNDSWHGDELVLASQNGNIKVLYEQELASSGSGFFQRLFGF